MEAQGGTFSAKPEGGYRDTHPLRKVTIMGAKKVSSVAFNGKKLENGWAYDGDAGVLTVELKSSTLGGAWSAEWKLEWR